MHFQVSLLFFKTPFVVFFLYSGYCFFFNTWLKHTNTYFPWLFRSVWTSHNKLNLADSTKYRAEASNYGYSALPTMLYRRLFGLSPLFSTFGIIVAYSLFFASHVTMKISLIFCRWRNCLYLKRNRSASLVFKSYGTSCPCFWIMPNTLNVKFF